jgi:3-hydroxybutyryl-CoA dehydrogenase
MIRVTKEGQRSTMANEIRTLGVFGAGTMGSGIAINAIANGLSVLLADTDADMQTRALERAGKVLSRWVEKGRMEPQAKEEALSRLTPADLEQAAGADVLIEAVFEDLAVKRDLMRRIDPHLKPGAIVATNTSALRVADIAVALSDPGRLVGLHYFSPAEINPLCELITPVDARPEAITTARNFLDRTGRVTLMCSDTPGFIVNRFFIPVYNEAVRLIEEGIATPGQIDRISQELFQAGAGLVTVMNVIGMRTSSKAAQSLAQLGPAYTPCPRLVKMGETNQPFSIDSDEPEATPDIKRLVEDRLSGAILRPAFELVDQGIATLEQVDTGAKLALKYARTPGAIIREIGEVRARGLATGPEPAPSGAEKW